MRITEIRCAGLRDATPAGGWANELRADDCVHTLVMVQTDEGTTGWGSVFTNDELVRAALRVLQPLYEGESALEPDRVTEKLHAHTFWMGRGGTLTHTISGINLALWDILGRVTGQPVGRLLGGRYRDRVRPYASMLMHDDKAMEEKLAALRADGFRAFKIGWGPFGRRDDTTDEKLVRRARDAVGEESLLMVDAGASDAFWRRDYPWATRTARMLAEYAVHWFEEPLPPDNLHDYIELRRRSHVPIAGGEVLTRRQSFTPWLDGHALDIVQPDVTKVGGLSDARRIMWRAEENGVRFVPHGWNTAIGLAADLQLASAGQSTDLVEYLAGSAFIDDLVDTPWRLDAEGMLPVPDGPGLGVAIDLDAVERHTGMRFDRGGRR